MKGLVFLVALLPAAALAADCTPDTSERPTWVAEQPRGYAFDYFSGQAEDRTSPIDAAAGAFSNAIATIVAKGLINVEVETSTAQRTHATDKNGRHDESTVTEVAEEVRLKGTSTKVEGLERVEQYLEQCEGGVHRVFALVRIPSKTPKAPPSSLDPVWRSAIGPGWGQFYKGYKGRGAFILIGEGVLIPTAIVTYLLSSNAASDAKTSTTQANRDFFQDRSDRLYLVSLVSAGAALALYVYNLIDAAAAPPRNTFAELVPTTAPGVRVAFAPTGLRVDF